MRHLRLLPCFLLACAALVCSGQAQLVSFGVKAGIPATPALPGLSYDNPYLDTGRWTVGYAVTHESTDLFGSSACLSGNLPCAPSLAYYNGEFTNSRNLTEPNQVTVLAGVSF
jgi:hypothetical protein